MLKTQEKLLLNIKLSWITSKGKGILNALRNREELQAERNKKSL